MQSDVNTHNEAIETVALARQDALATPAGASHMVGFTPSNEICSWLRQV